jgi:hypothetical protein
MSQSKSLNRFLLFIFFYSDLIVSFPDIYFCKDFKSFNPILHFVDQE